MCFREREGVRGEREREREIVLISMGCAAEGKEEISGHGFVFCMPFATNE